MRRHHFCFSLLSIVAIALLQAGCGAGQTTTLGGVTPTGNPVASTFKAQALQPPTNCLPCHQRQYDELRSSVKSGYRNVSPLFNGLESASNLVNGGLLRPVYPESTIVLPDGVVLNTNMFTTPVLTETRQVQAGFCFTCHNATRGANRQRSQPARSPAAAGSGR